MSACCNNGFKMIHEVMGFKMWLGLVGPPGPPGPPGSSVELRGPVATTSLLPESASSSELWMVGASSPYVGYFWNGTAWIEAGYILQGPQGEQGPAGADGAPGAAATVQSTEVVYQASASGTTVPSGSWSSSVPSVTQGEFLWTRTTVTFNTGSPVVWYAVAYQAENGTDGTNGQDGAPGAAATVQSTEVVYQASASGTTVPSGSWSSSVPSVTQGEFLWTRTTVTFNTGSPVVWYAVAYQAEDGATPANYTGTLAAASWSGNSAPYSNALTVSGLLATDKPIIDVVMSGTYSTDEARNSAWAAVYRAVASADTLTVYASEKPTVDLPIQIQCVR